MSASTRELIAILVAVAIASAWAGIGCMMLDKRLAAWPAAQAAARRLGYALVMVAVLAFFNGMGGFLTLVLLTGEGAGASQASVLGIPVPVPLVLERILIGVFAVVLDIGAVLSWVVAVVATVRLLRGKALPPPP